MADIKKHTDKIRKAIYGKEVRGALADGIEAINDEVEDNTEVAVNVEQRQDAIEQQFDDLQQNYTEDSPSDAEIVAARTNTKTNENYNTVGRRLDDEYEKVTAQLADTDTFRGKESTILRKNPTPMITWLDDDGQVGVYNKLYPLAQEYGIVFTSALITSRVGNREGYLDWNLIKEMHDSGLIEFVSHTHNHSVSLRPDQMTEEELREDYTTTKRILRERGLNYRCVVYPFGTYTGREVEIAKEYFDYAVGTSTRGNGLVTGKFDNYDLRRTNGQGYEWLDTVKEQIDRAVDENAWLLLTTHVDQGGWWSEEYAREVIEYALSKGVDFVTTEEGINAHGNVAQFDDNAITAKGEVYGSELGTVVIDNSVDIGVDTPIGYFKEPAITYTRIGANRGGFPDNKSGFLETYRLYHAENGLWSYQKFTTTRDKFVYKRYWDNEVEEWTEWTPENRFYFYPEIKSKYDDGTPIEDFPLGVTVFRLRGSDNTGMLPGNTGGVFTTYKIDETEHSWNYQEFKVHGSSNKYIRFVRLSGEWMSWKKVSLEDV